MLNFLATLIRFKEFVFAYAPFLLASWFGLAVISAIVNGIYRNPGYHAAGKGSPEHSRSSWPGKFLSYLLSYPGEKKGAAASGGMTLLFSLAISIPALAVTSILGFNVVLLRVALAIILVPFLGLILFRLLIPSAYSGEKRLETEPAALTYAKENVSQPFPGARSLLRAGWHYFEARAESAVVPLLIGFALASILTVDVPIYNILPWLGNGAWWAPYLAALAAMPFQLSGGAEVALASALMIKGAELGTALSVMLAAPLAVSSLVRNYYRPGKIRAVVIYLIAVWMIAGSLGLAVNGILHLTR